MPIFDISRYKEQKEWKNNEFLVNGDETTKKCRTCCTTYYTVEFLDDLSFPDGKLPVCSFCLKKKDDTEGAWEYLSKVVVRRECKRCEEKKDLSQFPIGGANALSKVCRDCMK